VVVCSVNNDLEAIGDGMIWGNISVFAWEAGISGAIWIREVVFGIAVTEREALLFQPVSLAYGIDFYLFIHLFLDYLIILVPPYGKKLEDDLWIEN